MPELQRSARGSSALEEMFPSLAKPIPHGHSLPLLALSWHCNSSLDVPSVLDYNSQHTRHPMVEGR